MIDSYCKQFHNKPISTPTIRSLSGWGLFSFCPAVSPPLSLTDISVHSYSSHTSVSSSLMLTSQRKHSQLSPLSCQELSFHYQPLLSVPTFHSAVMVNEEVKSLIFCSHNDTLETFRYLFSINTMICRIETLNDEYV